jgi:hypothetical protein
MPSRTIETNEGVSPLEMFGQQSYARIIGGVIKTGFSCSKGDVLGEITSGGMLRRRAVSAATGGFDNAADTGTVEDATVFKAGDVLTKADGTAIGTVESITAPHTVKLTGNAANDIAADALVIATGGSAVAAGIADAGSDGNGDTSIGVFISGALDESLINGLDATAKAELNGRSAFGGAFIF